MPRFDLSRPGGRVLAYFDFVFGDHAFLRLGFENAHWISPEMVRTNQPWPFQLAWWKRRGIRTVVNLRGESEAGHFVLEEEACRRLGLTLAPFKVFSREAPAREVVLGAKRLFSEIEYPALMHCKSGADRAGVMSVLYAHFRLGLPIQEAARQLSMRYGHFRQGHTGVLDYAFERYLAEADGLSYEKWVSRPDYDHAAVKRDFHASWWGTLLTEKLLRRE
ncbi:MAG TPA: protein tyrosine phosphatase [Caulobacteraceae bacterium]